MWRPRDDVRPLPLGRCEPGRRRQEPSTVLPLSPGAHELLRQHKATATGAYLFPGKYAARIFDNALRNGFNAACAAAKVARPTGIKSCNAWHLLRHSFGTEMSKDTDISTLSQLMTHGCSKGDVRVTQRYVHRGHRRPSRGDPQRRPQPAYRAADRTTNPGADRRRRRNRGENGSVMAAAPISSAATHLTR